MDASLRSRTEQLASEIASQARTIEDLNELTRLMVKSALERMLNTEMDVHLGRKVLGGGVAVEASATVEPRHRRPAPPGRLRSVPVRPTVVTGDRAKRCKATWAK